MVFPVSELLQLLTKPNNLDTPIGEMEILLNRKVKTGNLLRKCAERFIIQ
jgi:hypothetical protein